jgi:hypothetical protein
MCTSFVYLKESWGTGTRRRRRNAPIETFSFALAQSARTDIVVALMWVAKQFDETWGRSDALFLLLLLLCAKMEFIFHVCCCGFCLLFFPFWPRRCEFGRLSQRRKFSYRGWGGSFVGSLLPDARWHFCDWGWSQRRFCRREFWFLLVMLRYRISTTFTLSVKLTWLWNW